MTGQPPIAPTSPVQQMMNGLSTAQLTPEILQQLQQYQDQQRRMAMAQSLMGNNADPNTAYAGLANAGSDILGAVTYRNMQQKAADPIQPVNVTPQYNKFGGIGRLFGFGGIGS